MAEPVAPGRMQNALDRAWKKIQDYGKTLADHSTQDIVVQWQTNGEEWDAFGVTPDGTAFFLHGNGEDKNEESGYNGIEYFGHPYYPEGDNLIRYQCLEKLVRNWKIIKKMMRNELDELDEIYSFEV